RASSRHARSRGPAPVPPASVPPRIRPRQAKDWAPQPARHVRRAGQLPPARTARPPSQRPEHTAPLSSAETTAPLPSAEPGNISAAHLKSIYIALTAQPRRAGTSPRSRDTGTSAAVVPGGTCRAESPCGQVPLQSVQQAAQAELEQLIQVQLHVAVDQAV